MSINKNDKDCLLVVDDVPDNIDVFRALLKKDYELKAATSGEDALKVAAKHQPDLILLDIMMPGMDGFEVCRRLKAQQATQAIPVIFVTTLSEPVDEQEGFSCGAADYITKPIVPAILKARVNTQLALSKALLEAEELANQTCIRLVEILAEATSLFGHNELRSSRDEVSALKKILATYEFDNEWDYCVAAMLAGIGQQQDEGLGKDAANVFAADLLRSVPKMELVAEVVRAQEQPLENFLNQKKNLEDEPVGIGVFLLKLARIMVKHDTTSVTPKLEEKLLLYLPSLKRRSEDNQINDEEIIEIPLSELKVGMMLAAPIQSAEGSVFVPTGVEVTKGILDYLYRVKRWSTSVANQVVVKAIKVDEELQENSEPKTS